MSPPTARSRGGARGNSRGRGVRSPRLFRGQRIKRSGGRGYASGRGQLTLNVQNRQNWLNIDQASTLTSRQANTRRVVGSSLLSRGTSGFLPAGIRREAISSRSTSSVSGLSIEGYHNVEPLLSEEANSKAGRGREDLRASESRVLRDPHPATTFPTFGQGRAPFLPVISPWSRKDTIAWNLERKGLFPTPPESKHFVGHSGLTVMEGELKGTSVLGFGSALEMRQEKPFTVFDAKMAKKQADNSFGWFVHTDSLYNPIIPTLPRIVKPETKEGTDADPDMPVEVKMEKEAFDTLSLLGSSDSEDEDKIIIGRYGVIPNIFNLRIYE